MENIRKSFHSKPEASVINYRLTGERVNEDSWESLLIRCSDEADLSKVITNWGRRAENGEKFMKFIHLSDLHIGKRVNEFSMLEDQKYILAQILELVERECRSQAWPPRWRRRWKSPTASVIL